MSAAESKTSIERSPTFKTQHMEEDDSNDSQAPTPDTLKTLSTISPPGNTGPVIAIDLDDVLSQTNRQNPYWGDIQTTFTKVQDFYSTRKIFEALPVAGAREGVQALHDMGFRLIIVTARSPDVHSDSWHWVDKWFPGLFDSVICTGQFKDAQKNSHEVTTKLSKAQVCADLNAQLLIDDSSENALQVSTSTSRPTPVLLFGDYEWNSRLSSSSDAVDTMVFDTRLLIEGGKEFWKDDSEKFDNHVPEGAPLYRVKDWAAAVRWVKKAREEGRL
ncbi:hypothetical protein V5O48_005169 [Marasmius crinis-equi]|uniref:FCP1 homology domain-containing protein n=1 Tax=Marasmius crinis-equi TaxID=585013 RepID=A0ABR3FN02_9AGAR